MLGTWTSNTNELSMSASSVAARRGRIANKCLDRPPHGQHRCQIGHGAKRVINSIQQGHEPDDWKPMPRIGSAVQEIRIRDAAGA
jgi:hypothetical protein